MNSQHKSVENGRRKALKTLGMAAAAIAARPVISGLPLNALTGSANNLRVGMLLPKHSPSADAIMSGMKQFARNANGVTVDLTTGYAGKTLMQLRRGLESMVSNNKLDVVVGMTMPRTTGELRDIIERYEIPYVEVNAGERKPSTVDVSPYIFHNSLGDWQSAYTAGVHAARTMGLRAAIVASFYESGYDPFYAFAKGFESAGGKVTNTFVTNAPKGSHTPETVVAELRKNTPDVVYVLYTGSEAVQFMNAWKNSGLSGSVPVIGSGIIPAVPAGSVTVRSWSGSLKTDANVEFNRNHRSGSNRTMNGFAMLGYETAQLISQARINSGKSGSLREALASVQFDSPRGKVTMQPRTHVTQTPLYLCRVGITGEHIVSDLGFGDIAAMEHLSLPRYHGWINPYLSA